MRYNPIRKLGRWMAMAFGLLGLLGSIHAAESPLFELKRWKTDQVLKLADYSGQVVVLDFFAYWCVPCQRASADLETRVQEHYQKAGGNPQQIPVQVLAINVEKAQPAKTDRFIEKAGLRLVLDGADGKLLESLGGAGLPFILVLDGTKGTPAAPRFEILYQHEGFEGAEKLRKIIDGVGRGKGRGARFEPTAGEASALSHLAHLSHFALPEPDLSGLFQGAGPLLAQVSSAEKEPTAFDVEPSPSRLSERGENSSAGGGVPTTYTVDVEAEAILSRDFQLTQASLGFGISRGGLEGKLGVFQNTIDLDFVPQDFDFFNFKNQVDEDRQGAQFSLKQKLFSPVSFLLSGSLYEGFTDYRSAWLNEYYRQRYGFLPEYVPASPEGWAASTGLRWEYLPTVAFLQAEVGYSKDDIAPGYEIDFQGLRRGRPTLYSKTVRVSAENVVTRRIRLLNEFRFVDTSERESRYSYQGAINLALGEAWVWRMLGGYTQEDPRFQAHYFGSSLDYEVTSSFTAGLVGRYYQDTGEIENSLFSSAAPGVENYHFGLSLRYLWQGVALKLFGGPMFTHYQTDSAQVPFFGDLYRDRTWAIVQAACTIQF